MAAIQTATLNAARAMRLERESGTVEVGKRADLMLVRGDPLANISDLRRVTKAVRAGELLTLEKPEGSATGAEESRIEVRQIEFVSD